MKKKQYTSKGCRLLVATVVVMGLALSYAQAALYPDMPTFGPTDQFPSSFSAFTPPSDINMVVSSNAPQIAEWTRSNQPGDTMVLSGEDLSSFKSSEIGSDGFPVAFESDGVDDRVNTGVVPSASLSFEVDGIWPRDSSGWYQRGHGSEYGGHTKMYVGGGSEGFGFKFGKTDVLSSFYNNGFRNTLYVDRTRYGVNGDYVSWSPNLRFSTVVGLPIELFHYSASSFYPVLTIFRATIKNIDTEEVLFNAIVQADGTFYDTVSGATIINRGTGSLAQVIEGSQVPNDSGDEGKDTQFLFFGQDGATKTVADGLIHRLAGRHAAIELPESLPDNEFYLMWSRNSNGFGNPVAINKTEGWYVLPQYVGIGENFSVYGRNLITDKSNPTNYLYCVEQDVWLTATSANPYKADYTIPSGWPNGTYTLWPHNGKGRKYGWGESVSIVVDSVMDWSGGTVRDVTASPFNAVGDGVANDTAAIEAAITASFPKDTIYFPAGTYAIDSVLPLINNLRLLGDGMDSSTLTTHSTWSGSSGKNTFINKIKYSEIKDMTFDVGDYKTGDSLLWPTVDLGSERLRCVDVKFTMESTQIPILGGKLIEISHINDVTFKDCDFIIGRGLYSGGSTNILLENCNFYGMMDTGLLYYNWGGENVSMTGGTSQNLNVSDSRDAMGWCQGRVFHNSGVYNSCRNQYFGDHTTTNLMPRAPEPWVTSTPSAVTADSFTFTVGEVNQVNDSVITKVAWIIAGTGAGITKYPIADINKATGVVTLVDDWTVTGSQPDTSSTIDIIDPIANRNTGEQCMFEFAHTKFRDNAVSATSNTVVFASLTNDYSTLVAVIVAGRGQGQSREITNADTSGGTVMLAKPWAVIPDTTSVVMIGTYLQRAAVVNNYLDGTDLAVEGDAGVAVEGVSLFGGSFDVCVEDNTFSRMRRGISTWGMSEGHADYFPNNYVFIPNYFNYFADNLFDGCRVGIDHLGIVWGSAYPVIGDTALLGHVYRGNNITNSFEAAFSSGTSYSNMWGMTVFDQNVATDFPLLLDDDGVSSALSDFPTDARNQIWVGNTFTTASNDYGLIVRAPHLPVFHGNTFTGFHMDYVGDLPGPVLEMPRRIAEVSGGTYEFEIFNSGTDDLNWTASVVPSNSWISILNPTGTVPHGSRVSVSIAANTSIIFPYDQAVITISDGRQAKQMTIIYNPEAKTGVLGKNETRFPLSGFEGEKLRIELYVGDDEIPQILGTWDSPNEISLEDLSSYTWRKMILLSYDSATEIWEPVWTNWAGRSD